MHSKIIVRKFRNLGLNLGKMALQILTGLESGILEIPGQSCGAQPGYWLNYP